MSAGIRAFSLMFIWTQLVNASSKKWTYACTFPVQRKEINVVKVRFTKRYSSRKLNNKKVITTTCNFWRQIAFSFQIMSGNVMIMIRQKNIWNPAIFSNPTRGSGKKSSRLLITFFHPELRETPNAVWLFISFCFTKISYSIFIFSIRMSLSWLSFARWRSFSFWSFSI